MKDVWLVQRGEFRDVKPEDVTGMDSLVLWDYMGVTTDPPRRLRQHNGLILGGAKATQAGRPWSIAWLSPAMQHGDALREEWTMKHLTHDEKRSFAKEHEV